MATFLVDLDRLSRSALEEANDELEYLTPGPDSAHPVNQLRLMCSHAIEGPSAAVMPCFPSRHYSDRCTRTLARTVAAERLLQTALRHISKNAKLLSLELLGVPCKLRPLLDALRERLEERPLEILRASHIQLEGSRLPAVLSVASGCSALRHISLSSCRLTDSAMGPLVTFLKGFSRRLTAQRVECQEQVWKDSIAASKEARQATGGEPPHRCCPLRLDLSDNEFTDSASFQLAEYLCRDQALEAIDLCHNRLSPAGVEALKRAATQRCGVGDWGGLDRVPFAVLCPTCALSCAQLVVECTAGSGSLTDSVSPRCVRAQRDAHNEPPALELRLELALPNVPTPRRPSDRRLHDNVAKSSRLQGGAKGERRSAFSQELHKLKSTRNAAKAAVAQQQALLRRMAAVAAPHEAALTLEDWDSLAEDCGGRSNLLAALEDTLRAYLSQLRTDMAPAGVAMLPEATLAEPVEV